MISCLSDTKRVRPVRTTTKSIFFATFCQAQFYIWVALCTTSIHWIFADWRILMIFFIDWKPLKMCSYPPLSHKWRKGTIFNDLGPLTEASIPNLLHAQVRPLRLIIEVFGSETVLPVVRAIHTIEMIPKSMILIFSVPDNPSRANFCY